MKFKELVEEYLQSLRKTEEYGNEIGKAIVQKLQPVLPGLDYSVGWFEGGVEVICFYLPDSSKRLLNNSENDDDRGISLPDVIVGVFPELSGHVDDPFGVYLTIDEKDRVIQLLRELREE